MTRAEQLSRQDALKAVLTAAGWIRMVNVEGNETWHPPDLVVPPCMTFFEAIKNSKAAHAHPYWKGVYRLLKRNQDEPGKT